MRQNEARADSVQQEVSSCMATVNKTVLRNLISETYRSEALLEDDLDKFSNYVLMESGGVSKFVIKEANRLVDVIKGYFTKADKKVIDDGVAQCKISFSNTLFDKQFKFLVSIIDYRDLSVWKAKSLKFLPKSRAQIETEANIVKLVIDSIEGEIRPQTFENSLQHEIQHYYDVDKSAYSWADDSQYKMSIELMQNKEKDSFVRDILYSFGMMFYLSFRQEQSGFANGLYAFLKHCGKPLTRENIDKLSHSDESFSVIKLLSALCDSLMMDINKEKFSEAIDYINEHYGKQYSLEKLQRMCEKVLRDFVKRLNRAKAEALAPNIQYHPIIKKFSYSPLNYKTNGKKQFET